MQQKRLILALLISTAILFIWSYLAPVKPPQPNSSATTPTSSSTSTPGQAAQKPDVQQPAQVLPVGQSQQEPRRAVSVKTPLYEVKLDSKGAEVVSWIVKKNKDTDREINSVAGSRKQPVPLELVSGEGLKREPREAPLQLVTGDSSTDTILLSNNYRVEGASESGDIGLSLAPGDKKQIKFLLNDKGTGLEVIKTITFDAASYSTNVEVSLKRGGQPVPVKLRIGPSIGDQGVQHYSFYSVAPEGIAFVGDKLERHPAQGINENKSSPDRLAVNGPVDWAGVGDTYFAMVAIPSQHRDGLEYRTVQYDHTAAGKKDKRYLVSALVPVPADGRTLLYTGPKDHDLLAHASESISGAVQRPIDLGGLIDYGWFGWLSRPLAVPILRSIKWLRDLTNSYGIAIILFTIVIYSLFFPLKWRSSKAMKKAQKLAPRMKELQDKIKGMKQTDPRLKELQVEQLRLMKEGNPLGGCLPLLIQMPFLFALYRAITISLDFRQASFLWLPDLSSGDPLHILEILMAGTMIVLQLITPAPSADPMQRKMMAIGMPLFMLYVLWGAPSGLLVYWLVGNIVGFSQQFLINRWTKTEDDSGPPAPPAAVGKR